MDSQRSLVFKISEHLSKTDHDTICYLYKLPDSYKSCNASRLELLEKLEKMGKFSASRPDSLEMVLETIHRSDLVDMVRNDHSRKAIYRELCDQLAQAKLCYTRAKSAEEKLSGSIMQKVKSLTPETLEKRLTEVHASVQAQVTSLEEMVDSSRELVARHEVAVARRNSSGMALAEPDRQIWSGHTGVRAHPPRALSPSEY